MDEFEKEIEPALLLSMHSQEELGLKIETERNNDDPPDHFATINNSEEINLELTYLAENFFHKTNSFLDDIDEEISNSFQKHKSNLPSGLYLCFFEAGETITTEDGWEFKNTNFKNPLPKRNIGVQVDLAVKNLVENFERNNRNSQKLLNKNAEQIGIIHLDFKNESDQTIILTNEQKLNISHADPEYIYEQIQSTIDTKVEKYSRKYSSDEKKWWLLIHDLKNFTNSDLINDSLSDGKFKITFFEKVLFMRSSYKGVKISDLKKS